MLEICVLIGIFVILLQYFKLYFAVAVLFVSLQLNNVKNNKYDSELLDRKLFLHQIGSKNQF